MSQQGAALQTYNNELVKCIEDLTSKRDDIQRQILQEEQEKEKIQNDVRLLSERLAKIQESLAKKIQLRNDFDRTENRKNMKIRMGLNFHDVFSILFAFYQKLRVHIRKS